MKSIGNRMKSYYEDRNRTYLTRRVPVIMRLDGQAFHTLTRGAKKPFDQTIIDSMTATAEYLMKDVTQGSKCAYVQSDEISILITDFDTIDTEAWFDYNVQKMVSISAGHASIKFSELYKKQGVFDSRVWNHPKEDVVNYFLWRQQDWLRNSLSMLAQSHFPHKQLHGKKREDMHEMLFQKGINWAELHPQLKNGTFMYRDSLAGIITQHTTDFKGPGKELIQLFLTEKE